MILILLYLIFLVLTAGPTAVKGFKILLSNKSLTNRSRYLLLSLPVLIPLILAFCASFDMSTSTRHLPQTLLEGETSAQIRGTQMIFIWAATLIGITVYLTTLISLFRNFGNHEIPNTEEE